MTSEFNVNSITKVGPHNIFSNLDALRLSPQAAVLSGTSEVLTHIPVRKPNRHEFFRTNPNPEMWFNTGIFEDKEEREVFFVTPVIRDALVGEIKPVILAVTINRQSVLSLWPLNGASLFRPSQPIVPA